MLNLPVPVQRAPLALGSRSALQSPSGSAGITLMLESYDLRARTASYFLRVQNESASDIACSVWGSHAGHLELVFPNPVDVAAHATKELQFLIPLRPYDPLEQAVVKIYGEGIALTVEAPGPPLARSFGFLPVAAALAVATLIVFLGALLFAVPHILAFSAPPLAMTGTTVDTQYATGGFGKLSYSLHAVDGRIASSGTLTTPSGILSVALPASVEPASYTLELVMTGPLGTATTQRIINATPLRTRQAPIASIQRVDVEPAVVNPGDAVRVSYAAVGEGGTIRLVDERGTTWAQVPFSSRGESTLRVPAFETEHELHAVVSVDRGDSNAKASAGFLVRDRSDAATESGTEPITVASSNVRGGDAIDVRIAGTHRGLRVMLTDEHSNQITSAAVSNGVARTTLRAPLVATEQRYYVVAQFEDAGGQESAVVPVTVHP